MFFFFLTFFFLLSFFLFGAGVCTYARSRSFGCGSLYLGGGGVRGVLGDEGKGGGGEGEGKGGGAVY